MSVLGAPPVAAVLARLLQGLAGLSSVALTRRARTVFPEHRAVPEHVAIPTSVARARATIYRPTTADAHPPVYVNFHGGGFVMPGVWLDDPLCRYVAAEAGAVVVNVDYALAPQYRFPAPPRQAFEVVRWVVDNGADHGWDGGRIAVGGQSAGAALAAATARQALEQGGPPIALQVLHYPPLDLTIRTRDKPAAIARPMLRPWMGEIFDNAYVPDPAERADRLVSPANPADTADLTGIAPALLITPEHDRLHAEGLRYAERLRGAGALLEHRDVPGADHGYDTKDLAGAREIYGTIARRIGDVSRR